MLVRIENFWIDPEAIVMMRYNSSYGTISIQTCYGDVFDIEADQNRMDELVYTVNSSFITQSFGGGDAEEKT